MALPTPRFPGPGSFVPGEGLDQPRAGFSSPRRLIPKGVVGSSTLCPAWKAAASISGREKTPFSAGRKTTRISISAGRTEVVGKGRLDSPRRAEHPAPGVPRGRLSCSPLAPLWGDQVEPPSFPEHPVISARPMPASRIRPWEGAVAASGCEAGAS